MFALQSTTDPYQGHGMSAIGGSRPTIADLLRAAGGAPATPTLISSINATNLAARALLASKLTAEQKAYVASRMGAIDCLGSHALALAKLQAGQRLIEQAKHSLDLDAAFRAQVAAASFTPVASTAKIQTQPTEPAASLTTQTSPQAGPTPTRDCLVQLNQNQKKSVNPLHSIPKQDGKGNFPVKLHAMLSDLEKIPGGSDVASFLPHGRAFAIHKPRDFVRYVMPKYFKMGRFSSFQRQLNLYDFNRIGSGVDKGAYSHPMFIYGHYQLTLSMKRNKIKGVKAAKAAKANALNDEGSATSHDEEEETLEASEGDAVACTESSAVEATVAPIRV